MVTVQQALERLGAREVLHDMYCSKTNTEVCAWVWAGVSMCAHPLTCDDKHTLAATHYSSRVLPHLKASLGCLSFLLA